MQISDFLVKICYIINFIVFYKSLWILAEKITLWKEFPFSNMKNSKSSSVYGCKNLFFYMEFLKSFDANFDIIFHIFPINQ